jgi:hypothetical protein
VGADRDWGLWSLDVHREWCATVEGGEQVVPLPERGEGCDAVRGHEAMVTNRAVKIRNRKGLNEHMHHASRAN